MESRGHEGLRVFLNACSIAPPFPLAAQAKIKSVLKKLGCIGVMVQLSQKKVLQCNRLFNPVQPHLAGTSMFAASA